MVALHQTTNVSIDEIAGVSGPAAMQIGLKLAQRGFIIFCPRCFLWQDAVSLHDAVRQHRSRHPETLGMAKMLYDATRAVDPLSALPQVDEQRISTIGHSLGAKEVLYLAAFDERVRAAVSCEGGLGFRSTNWDADWYLGPAIRDPQFELNHHQLLALAAPRPLLVVGGESGPGGGGRRAFVGAAECGTAGLESVSATGSSGVAESSPGARDPGCVVRAYGGVADGLCRVVTSRMLDHFAGSAGAVLRMAMT
ncbi:hypothetical protein E3A20_10820 [Planctomyces bekefii]|uniref:Dienelactone hydrolase domain-containing protein n=1 Tax=Planctomyces bekefii TaxID=1653850 RepID=A0A5C6MA27_9PLAN|nr:hypothetical protein E3A20_10820 [Planctomyces bekefii]